MDNPPKIDQRDLVRLEDEIGSLCQKHKKELSGKALEDIYFAVEEFKQEYLVIRWIHSHLGFPKLASHQVVSELYGLYPEFARHIQEKQIELPSFGECLTSADEDIFYNWLENNSPYRKTWGAVAALMFSSDEVRAFQKWKHQHRPEINPSGYLSFDNWRQRLKDPELLRS